MWEVSGGRVSILGAAGAVGSLFAQRLQDSACSITGVDLRPPPDFRPFDRFVVGDVTSPDPLVSEALSGSGCLILCLPEAPALRVMDRVAHSRSLGLVVDTLSVKTAVCERTRQASPSWEHLSMNPMFAPSLGFERQTVAVVARHAGPDGAAFLAMIRSWGARVVELSAEQHDRICAATQAATHAALIALASLCLEGCPIEDLLAIAPPPHRVCLALAARIASAAPETYWDIQRQNPYAGEFRRKFVGAVMDLDRAAEADERAVFTQTLDAIRRGLGSQLHPLSDVAKGAIRGALDAEAERGGAQPKGQRWNRRGQ